MSKQVQEAYIVAATRTRLASAARHVPQHPPGRHAGACDQGCDGAGAIARPASIGDVIVGCAMPEAEQGMNVARIGLLLAGLPDTVPGLTVNRFCSSGVQAVALAADRIRVGEAMSCWLQAWKA